jgi:hypothetical protein
MKELEFAQIENQSRGWVTTKGVLRGGLGMVRTLKEGSER